MDYSREELKALAFAEAPPLDADFKSYEATKARSGPDPDLGQTLEERQRNYAERCRQIYSTMTSESARDHHLSQGVHKTWLKVKSRADKYDIPVMQLELSEYLNQQPDVVVLYIHGGGLYVGEADSEELTCRRMLKGGLGKIRVYSIGYRLMNGPYSARCVADALDCVCELREVAAEKTILMGSSSGGELASFAAQREGMVRAQTNITKVHGLLLRGPVTTDAYSGRDMVPGRFRDYHTSVKDSFLNSMSFYLKRQIPRDGLQEMPLEASDLVWESHPKTWIQISTNDTLYSDGLCYAMALQAAQVEVRLDVIHGWPHTFWLVAPELARSLKAEEDMMEGLRWLTSPS